jgi:hypothetical protein
VKDQDHNLILLASCLIGVVVSLLVHLLWVLMGLP